jgi:hypothetical protein
MGDLMNFDSGDSGGPPSPRNLARRGLSAVGFLAAGAGLFVMGSLPGIVGIVAGAAACFFGIGSAFSHDRADRMGGSVLFAGGALTLLAKLRIPILAGLSSVVLSVGAVACIGLGIWNGIKFLRGLKDRG